MDFIKHDDIELRYFSDEWGTFLFDFTDALPASAVISEVAVKAYLNIIKPSADIASLATITSDIIDSDYTPEVVNSTQVAVKFNYTEARKGTKATLIFELTTEGGAKHPFFFHHVKTV